MTTNAQRPATDDQKDLAGHAMDAIRRIVRALRTADGQSEAVLGLTTAQLFVMREIEKAGRPTIGELAKRTATAQSSVSEVVARLVARGLLAREKSTEDRRRAEISLTEEGTRLLSSAAETVQERMLAAFRTLPPARQREIAQGLGAWITAAGLGAVAPTMFFEPTGEEP